jgi:tetratricopeptide (TPR) repeat protein
MPYSEEQSARRQPVAPEPEPQPAAIGGGSTGKRAIEPPAIARPPRELIPQPPATPKKGWHLGRRWWMVAAGAALVLTMLTVAAVYLLTRKPSTVDQLIILTVPSGATVTLDSKDYGHTPVKLEQLTAGPHTITIEKENYESISEQINLTPDTVPLEYKLKVLASPEATGTPEEVIKKFEDRANDAFANGQYLMPYQDSALYFAQQLQRYEDAGANDFATDMIDRIRRIELQAARDASNSGDMGKAREIYNALSENYPDNEEVRASVAKFENQISQHRGDVQNYLKKATDAFQAGILADPLRSSAYFYSKQVLAIDKQNAQARSIYNQVKETLTSRAEDANRRGDVESAIRQLENIARLYPDDKALQQRAREIESQHSSEVAKANDPGARRVQGLQKYQSGDYAGAIVDLQFAVDRNRATPDVIFALAHSHMMKGQLEQAAHYFRQVPVSSDDQYRSAIAALGDIAKEQGDSAGALEKYKQAKSLGGSTLYSIGKLDDRIEQIEKKQRVKAAEPVAVTIQAKHLHGGIIGGSCSGTLTVNSTGVRYEGSNHTFSANLLSAGVRVSQDEMVVKFQDKNEKFKVTRGDAERFNEALSRFQQFYSPANK